MFKKWTFLHIPAYGQYSLSSSLKRRVYLIDTDLGFGYEHSAFIHYISRVNESGLKNGNLFLTYSLRARPFACVNDKQFG